MSFRSSPHDCHVRSFWGAFSKYLDLGLSSELLTELAWSSDSEVEAGRASQAVLTCFSTLERHSGNVVGRKEGGQIPQRILKCRNWELCCKGARRK